MRAQSKLREKVTSILACSFTASAGAGPTLNIRTTVTADVTVAMKVSGRNGAMMFTSSSKVRNE